MLKNFDIKNGNIKVSKKVSSKNAKEKKMTAYLETKNLVKIYNKRVVVDHVNLSIHQGEIVGILGPNGAGKTTTFRMVVGLITADYGDIFYNNKNISKMAMYKRARLGIGYLPQEPTIFARLTAQENLQIILEHMPLTRKQQREKCQHLLAEMGLEHLSKSKAGSLSGGERRRLEVARALVNDPTFLMLDEPFAAIVPKVVENLQELILQLKEKNIGILITDHKPRETLSITDRTYIINKGKILRHGNTKELVEDEEVRKLYLGEKFFMPEVQSTEEFLRHDRHELVKKRIEEKSYADATRLLTEMIGLNSTETDLYFQRAQCFWHMKDIPSARLDIERCLSDNPEHKEAQKFLRKYLVHNA